jgi:alpha-D-ribose 1-methylphosphonate 5-phosphate C-P lyase
MRERRSTWRGDNRRGPLRPTNGDTRACPDCGGEMMFHDEPVLLDHGRRVPGWVCSDRHCNAREYVRPP